MAIDQLSTPDTASPIWEPDPDQVATSQIAEFSAFVTSRTGVEYREYHDLWTYSVTELAEFWSAVATYYDVAMDDIPDDVLPSTAMPGARWFPGAGLNYTEHALRQRGSGTAIIAENEDGVRVEVSSDDLRGMVGAVQQWLRTQRVQRGDRVVAYLPNTLHTVVAMLATTAIGAVWSVCGPDYASDGALARLRQLEPTVLIATDGYRWSGTAHDRRREVSRIADGLPTVRTLLRVSVLGYWDVDDRGVDWAEVVSTPAEPTFDRVEFNDPLWVLFSSGTTGVPKGIVHSHGGVLLDHLKLLGLHNDLRPGDRFFWYTTTNWMMWNMVTSGLLVGATIVLYDGSPTHPGPDRLWRIAAEHRVTVLGVSPGYLAAGARAGLHPRHQFDLDALRLIGSTGAPLPATSYHWVHEEVGGGIQVASTSGGTDVVSGFAGSAPTTAVWPGEISAPLLGVALESWSVSGDPLIGEVGELVITRPMPSIPIHFWNDPGGQRYHAAYFDMFPGVWRHGDWITVTERGSVTIAGRSDATLNRHGVRLGSADIYEAVETLGQIRESLVIGAELDDGSYWLPLFVVMADGHDLDDTLRATISATIRSCASPRHVPDDIIAVPAIPHTRTGKKLEVPVKRLIQGWAYADVTGVDTVDDPDALAYFGRFANE